MNTCQRPGGFRVGTVYRAKGILNVHGPRIDRFDTFVRGSGG